MKSMTGYGRKEQTIGDKVFLVEIKSLNGKQLDIQLKLPSILKAYEMDIRNLLQESLIRGSIECMIVVKQNGTARPVSINTELVNAYYQQMHQVAKQNGADDSGILAAILRLPEVVAPATDMLSENDFSALKTIIAEALGELDKHRLTEGAVLKQDLIARRDKPFCVGAVAHF
ncbi:MAG: YicC/YloC family endoribonuclease [Ferruginibacter sp.]